MVQMGLGERSLQVFSHPRCKAPPVQVQTVHRPLSQHPVRCTRSLVHQAALPDGAPEAGIFFLGTTAFGAAAKMPTSLAGGSHTSRRSSFPFVPRFISGKEIKKRKGLFGLHLRVPPPAPRAPESPGPPLISRSR